MSPVTSDGFCHKNMPAIFHGMTFEQDLVMGRNMSSAEMRFEDHAYSDHMDVLLKKMNNSEPVQREIDRYLLTIYMICSGDPLLLTQPPALFVAMTEHVLTVQHLPNIGCYISRLIINHNHSAVDLMSKLIHYSMP